MMIAPNSRERNGAKKVGRRGMKGEYGRIREEEGIVDYGGMV